MPAPSAAPHSLPAGGLARAFPAGSYHDEGVTVGLHLWPVGVAFGAAVVLVYAGIVWLIWWLLAL